METDRPDPDDLKRRLAAHPLAVLATHGAEYPYTSLVSVALTADARAFLFPTGRETRKFANLLRQARVSLLLDNRGGDLSDPPYAITVLGQASEVTPDAPDRGVLEAAYLERQPHLAGFLAGEGTALIRVELDRVILVERFSEVFETSWPPPAEPC
jgi:nitroimidazol reductase NimA-like FMN-containing flavoprotein (pyridoxamine 5'-phosphate oxidase superfamily)